MDFTTNLLNTLWMRFLPEVSIELWIVRFLLDVSIEL
jgi:hypothetical protein